MNGAGREMNGDGHGPYGYGRTIGSGPRDGVGGPPVSGGPGGPQRDGNGHG